MRKRNYILNCHNIYIVVGSSSGMVKMKCSKCKHEWNYKGKSKYYVTCPHCYRKIKIKK